MKMDLDRTIPSDETGFEVLNNFLMFRKQATSGRREKLDPIDYILAKAIGTNGKISRRALQRCTDQVHVKNLIADNVIVFSKFKFDGKGSLLRRELLSLKTLEVRWRKTPKGIMYCCKPCNSSYYMLFCAHFFDRFVERGLEDDSVTRLLAVGKFLWTLLQRETNKGWVSDGGEMRFFCDEGAALGFKRVMTNRGGTLKVPVVFFKTFISREMFTLQQERIEQGADYLPPLNYEHD